MTVWLFDQFYKKNFPTILKHSLLNANTQCHCSHTNYSHIRCLSIIIKHIWDVTYCLNNSSLFHNHFISFYFTGQMFWTAPTPHRKTLIFVLTALNLSPAVHTLVCCPGFDWSETGWLPHTAAAESCLQRSEWPGKDQPAAPWDCGRTRNSYHHQLTEQSL